MVMALTVFRVRNNSLELKAGVCQAQMHDVCMHVCLKTVMNLPFKHTYTMGVAGCFQRVFKQGRGFRGVA